MQNEFILTSKQRAEHPFAGQNTQHLQQSKKKCVKTSQVFHFYSLKFVLTTQSITTPIFVKLLLALTF